MHPLETTFPEHVLRAVDPDNSDVMASPTSEVIIIDEQSAPVTIHYQSFFEVDGGKDIIVGFRPEADKIDISGLFASLGADMDEHNLRFIRREGNIEVIVNDDEYGYGENEYVICVLYDCHMNTRDILKTGIIRF